jgi:hypothetical protein
MTAIEEHNIYPSGTISSPIQYVRVKDIKVDPHERIRKDFDDYEKSPTYIALENSIIKYGVRNPVSLRADYVLVEGYYRYSIVLKLGWEFIPAFVDNLTELQAIELELEENMCRKNFNDYSTYCGIARLKEIYERDNPDTQKGKYNRDLVVLKDHKSISASDALMISKNKINTESFVAKYTKELGIARRTLFLKVQIGEAIRSGKFNQKTIKAIEHGNISERKLLEKLRRIENRQIIKERLNNVTNSANTPSESLINSEKKISKKDEDNKSSKSKKIKTKKSKSPHNTKSISEKEKNILNFSKTQEIIEAAKSNKEIQKICEKIKKGVVSVDEAYKETFKIKSLRSTMRMEEISNLKKAGEKNEKKNSSISIEGDEDKKISTIKGMYICRRCSKATLVGQENKCEECGHLNYSYSVMCDDDYSNGFRRLRDPNAVLCKNSPDYDLISKNPISRI